MALEQNAGTVQSKAFYEVFSLQVGLRDWLAPSARHAHLRVLVEQVLGSRTNLRILDVGCGAGVMTSFLTSYGDVIGTDFSHAAIAAAQRIAPEATFIAGTLDDVPTGPYDAIMLFDVLEHIPEQDRPSFLQDISGRLTADGILFMSTPHPDVTALRRSENDPSLQIVDEEVRLQDVVREAEVVNLQLIRYQAFDVFQGSPEYQLLVFRPRGIARGGPAVLVDPRVSMPNGRVRRLRLAARSARRGDLGLARWFLTGRPPQVES